MPTSRFQTRDPVRPTDVVAPWSYRDGVPGPLDMPYGACFVGDELWAQTGGCIWRLAPPRPPRLFRVTNALILVRTEGRWVEFRSKDGWNRPPWSTSTYGIHLFSLDADDWYEGPWPDGVSSWMREAIEPEDFVLVDPFAGKSLDVARDDRHDNPVFGPGSHIARIDGRIIELATGEVMESPAAPTSNELDELFPGAPPLVIADATDALPAECFLAEAVARTSAGSLWWIDHCRSDQGSWGLVGVDERPLAALSAHWRAAAFDAQARRLALVSPRRVLVLETAQLDGRPVFSFEFPWPWPDPFEATAADVCHGTDALRARQAEYRRTYRRWLEHDDARRTTASKTQEPDDPATVEFVVVDDDEDIPF